VASPPEIRTSIHGCPKYPIGSQTSLVASSFNSTAAEMSASEGIEAAMAAGDDALAVASEDEQHEEAGSLLQIGSLFECCP